MNKVREHRTIYRQDLDRGRMMRLLQCMNILLF